jgi:hypothetical protein
MTSRISDPTEIVKVDGVGWNPETPQHACSGGVISNLCSPSGGRAREREEVERATDRRERKRGMWLSL